MSCLRFELCRSVFGRSEFGLYATVESFSMELKAQRSGFWGSRQIGRWSEKERGKLRVLELSCPLPLPLPLLRLRRAFGKNSVFLVRVPVQKVRDLFLVWWFKFKRIGFGVETALELRVSAKFGFNSKLIGCSFSDSRLKANKPLTPQNRTCGFEKPHSGSQVLGAAWL